MTRFYYLPVAVAAAVRRLRTRQWDDRGDSPVPTAVIIAGLVVLAVAIVAWVYVSAEGFMSEAPTELPDGPNVPG